ncbi:MAG: hypothetical protein ABIW82_07995 [Dokdonella sp.]
MKKRWTVLIAFVSLIVGVSGASWFWLNFNAQFTNYGFVVRTEADIVTKVAVLEHIRAGQISDATKLLETLLDGDLIGARSLARDGTKFNANTRRAVALELQARAVSGYAPADENVRNAVQEAFRLLPAPSEGAAAQLAVPGDAAR